MEQCDLYSGVCHECTATAAAQRGEVPKKTPGALIWAGRIGHVLVCALLGAPFGVLGLGFMAILGLFALTPAPMHGLLRFYLFGWFALAEDAPRVESEDMTILRSEGGWKAQVAFGVTLAILIVCFSLDGWRGFLIGGAALGTLIGATLSILSQWPAKATPRKR
jgi:hypothetical protein